MELETVNKLYLELSQVATATTAKELALRAEVARLTLELDEAGSSCSMYKQQVLNANAREAKLLKTISDEATAIAFYGDQPPQWMLDLIALPTDDSALMERLKEERECVYVEMFNQGYINKQSLQQLQGA